MMVCALMTIILILEQHRRSDGLLRWLIAWSTAATLLYSGHFIFFHQAKEWLPISDTVYVTTNLLVYPLYLIYISELTDEHPITERMPLMALALAPAVLAGIACGSLYAVMTSSQTADFIDIYLYGDTIGGLARMPSIQARLHDACHMLFAIQATGTAIIGIRKVKLYNLTTALLYADTDDKEARGLATLFVLTLVTIALSVLVNKIGRPWFSSDVRLILPSVGFSALLFAIGWAGLQQRFSARDIRRQHADREVTPTTKADTVILCGKLETLMNDSQLYLRHDLRLEETAKLIGTNRTYLLQALSQGMHMTFKEYVNRKRIAHAEKLIANNPSLQKTEIATLSGYNSMASFYRNYNLYRQH